MLEQEHKIPSGSMTLSGGMSAQKDHSPGRTPAGACSQTVWVQQKTNSKKSAAPQLRKRNLTEEKTRGKKILQGQPPRVRPGRSYSPGNGQRNPEGDLSERNVYSIIVFSL